MHWRLELKSVTGHLEKDRHHYGGCGAQADKGTSLLFMTAAVVDPVIDADSAKICFFCMPI